MTHLALLLLLVEITRTDHPLLVHTPLQLALSLLQLLVRLLRWVLFIRDILAFVVLFVFFRLLASAGSPKALGDRCELSILGR